MPARPFARFDDLLDEDPYALAAAALGLFDKPKIEQEVIYLWLCGLVDEKPSYVLGISLKVPVPVEAVTVRILLVWERAMVAGRWATGSDTVTHYAVLLDRAAPTRSYAERLALLRGETPTLR